MDYLGSIVKAIDPPGVDQHSWIKLIASHPSLAAIKPREGINPLTRKPIVIPPKPTTAHVLVEGKEVGVMSWAQDETNAITVEGYDAKEMKPIAKEIAYHLGAVYEPWEK